MKTLIASALVATAALTGAANASLSSDVQTYAPGADISSLSAAETASLHLIVNGGGTESEKRNAVRKIVN
ncbi:hypothetical protein TRP8649_03868 [Pelagimonas phthalicica]|uniref:Uncharacterized protein n=1 Tax=Pelagimonas phthalicica TaxID=1037362 RepID=A0A238JHL7_9RHOB|nr:hypothetical protein [Pelagimonas phthalicica]TDS89096.1 hypothetical protein CLV87_4285 [Pelagimonas phthalicica]TDS89121.1 hypothetical protein CLV87_4311 [Pelagimonas phthalicica]SMX29704.1 hypothetical protein TRP8649_03842 [Pelagimonas phthalicica]SMX29729.1 hypothetical protein TRP8649_03868 [Pelagimonas phthalicica]